MNYDYMHKLLSLEGKNAIITGGSQGIGKGIAISLAQFGCAVTICGRNDKLLAETKTEIEAFGGQCETSKFDISKEEEVERFFADYRKSHDKLDIYIGNAGYTKDNVVGTNFKYNNKNLVTGATLPSSGMLNSYTVYAGDDGVHKLSGAYTIGLGASKTRYTVASDAKMFVIDSDGVITKVADVKDITTDTSAEYIALFDNTDGDIDYLFVQEVDNGKTETGSGNVTPGTVTKLDYNASTGEVKVTADKAGKYTVTVEVLSNGTYVKAASYTAVVPSDGGTSADIVVGKLTAGNARIVCGDVVVLA